MPTSIPSFIDGRGLDCSGERFVKLDPGTGSAMAWMHKARQADVDAAMDAARRGFRQWSATPAEQRLQVLAGAAALMRERDRELAGLEAQETGRPLDGVLVSSVQSGADCLDDFANAAALLFDAEQPARTGTRTVYEPLGVCVGVGSSHRPLHSACAQTAPALAAGNAVVFKPSELAPAGALRLAQILCEAGLPPGVFNVLQGKRGTAGMLLGHHDAAVVLAGPSQGSGSVSNATAGSETIGGDDTSIRSTLIIFDDADIEAACSAAVSAFDSHGATGNGGACVFVQKGVASSLVARLAARAGRLRIGPPTGSATKVGPLTDGVQLAGMLRFINACVDRGAKLAAGGYRAADPDLAGGFFIAPTVLADCTDDMLTPAAGAGPLMAVSSFDDECEVLERANAAIRCGTVGIFTRDADRAHRVIAALRTETAWINTFDPPTRPSSRDRMDANIASLPGHWAALLRLVRVKRIHAEAVRYPSTARVAQAQLEL